MDIVPQMTKSKASGPKLIGYARVSTDDQSLQLQTDALKAAGCWNIHEEKISGAAKRRKILDLAIMDLRPGDTLVVWRIDRLARSMRELYARLDAINAAGATFKSLQENFSFDTAMGKFVLGILGLVAELERQLTIARTRAGMEAVRKLGVRLGRARTLTPAKVKQARKLLAKKGWNARRVAEKFGVTPTAIYHHIPGGKKAVTGKLQYVRRKRK